MPARRHTLVLLLLLAGAGLASALMAAGVGTPAPLADGLALAALGVGALPPVADRVGRLLGRVRRLTPAARRRATLGVWVTSRRSPWPRGL